MSKDYGFFRMAVCSPEMRVADVAFNVAEIGRQISVAHDAQAQIVLFPEMGVTGYTCADLFHQSVLLDAAEGALPEICKICAEKSMVAIVGLPLRREDRLYNCAVVIDSEGRIRGVVPKTFLPNTGEFYEQRWFASGESTSGFIDLLGHQIPFGTDLLFANSTDFRCIIGIEVCEDLWAVSPPSSNQALAGANIILNPSASNELLGKYDYRRSLVLQQSARCLAAYVYASAGPGESSTDVVYSGHCLIAENGALLSETPRFKFESQMTVSDVDLQHLQHDRLRNSSFSHAKAANPFRTQPLAVTSRDNFANLKRKIDPAPFVPADLSRRAEHCQEIFSIQSLGLAKRIRHTGLTTITIGLSGGLDSTLAVLVAAAAFDKLKLDRSGIIAVTMPGFGTTKRTKSNATKLAQILGLTLRTISISAAVSQHFEDIGHPHDQHDVTFENAQARERTQVLMDIANQTGGFVLGTGDLSELALGWCTFNGDHMSMYHVNCGVPKTLVRHLVTWCADEIFKGDESDVLKDICETPISPELLPAEKSGEVGQKTEELVGPYELHDFFLFHMIRHGSSPEKITFLAKTVFADRYPIDDIKKWLGVFCRRFIAQQFKRSAMPDGPKVGSVALSPRGDWRMPSDASPAVWLLSE